jgi:hypothetical protein
MDIEFGNAGVSNTNGTGWFIGSSDWAKANIPRVPDLRYMAKDSLAHTIQVKWMVHPAGDDRGTSKPPSDGRSISILVSEKGRLRLEFSGDRDFPEGQVIEHVVQNHGDFVIWGENIHHRWFVDQECIILTIRWIPIQASHA